ncbi:DUF2147 domain-containing protein [Arenibacterium halophilum]|uniref:DUF2147 domain-containing protein n=1 Tax=Arenibacterium halophilum TaxID=2583821 RepID=A0ABY2X709_9RHOB|nr:DUF2147 domain-containing protein [Arenibacterium halophilum]TMV11556.1 DUF2147 domain-containing protein [Arenibacterium halophilum]
MKQFATLFLISLFAASPALADPIEGLWRTAPDDHGDVGFIRVGICGTNFCGVLERAENAQGEAIQPDTLGRQIVWSLTHSTSTEYQGRIYAPDRDKEYMSKLELSGDRISVNGCVLGGLICRNGGQWTRVQ